MFIDLKCNTFKIQVSDYLNPMENSAFQFSVSDFHSENPILLNMGYKSIFWRHLDVELVVN